MAKGTYHMSLLLFFLFQLLCNTVTSSDTPLPHAKDLEVVSQKEPLFPSIHRALAEYIQTEFDSIDPPTTALPSTSITNPVTTPAVNTAPGIITVPGINPATNPVNPPVPITNPVNPPVPITNPVNPPVPITNPVNPPVPITNPVTTPSTNQPTASGLGQTWCIAKNGASQMALQSALDYACGIGGADCATIQQGSSCYEPATLQNHASYAFNSYYQKNPVPTSCDFGGAAAITTTNPSTGSCVYPSSSASSPSSPTPAITQTPVNPTSLPAAPATSLPTVGPTLPGIQSPPSGFSFGNPDSTGLGSFGASPPLANTASVVSNSRLGLVVVVAFIIMFGVFGC